MRKKVQPQGSSTPLYHSHPQLVWEDSQQPCLVVREREKKNVGRTYTEIEIALLDNSASDNCDMEETRKKLGAKQSKHERRSDVVF